MKEKQKTFSTVQEILNAYFPNNSKKTDRKDFKVSGTDLAIKLAKEYPPNNN